MGHPHVHSTPAGRTPPEVRRLLAGVIAVLVIATVVGVAVLWPTGSGPEIDSELLGTPTDLVDGTVVGESPVFCAGTDPEAKILCVSLDVRLTDGPDEGQVVALEFSPSAGQPVLERGDRIVLGFSADAPGGQQYYFADFQRRTPLIWLGAMFVVVVVALARWLGVRALAGTAFSLIVLGVFVVPALLHGGSPVWVASVGSSVIMLVALYGSHGVNARTTAAVLGTLLSLGLTVVLASVFVAATQLTGFASEEAVLLRALSEQIDIRGLLLAGMIVGSLGVLDDVTVTQASAVWELHHANPGLNVRELYASAIRIGRDHVASVVNTLVLAYAGASLALLVLFQQSDRPLGDIATGEVVAVEIVRTLVGSIGLVASVPITTLLAALVVRRTEASPAPVA